MEAEVMALGGPDPAPMHETADETLHASASSTALTGQAPTGVGPALSLRARILGEGPGWYPDATRRTVATHPRPAQ